MSQTNTGRVVVRGGIVATMNRDNTTCPYGRINDGSVAIESGRIAWVGPTCDLPAAWADAPTRVFPNQLVTPALIDCHTHLIHGGNRAKEFELRLMGASYAEIARKGGGILSTVEATRTRTVESLVEEALPRLTALVGEGVTTVEIKSGYGLTVESELRMLRAARALGRRSSVRVTTTYLAAHAVPPEYEDADLYVDEVVLPGMEQGAREGLIDAVDGFCEAIAFTPAQIRRVFQKARALGLPVKLHAEQLSNLGGAALAASFGALSADHLEYLDQEGVEAMAEAGTVAVLLPGAFYTLRETQRPPVDALRAAGVPMAVATDANPGSSPLTSLLLAMNLAATLFHLTPAEALAGVTREAARALGFHDLGAVLPGHRAELAVWDVRDPAELSYHMGLNPLREVLKYDE